MNKIRPQLLLFKSALFILLFLNFACHQKSEEGVENSSSGVALGKDKKIVNEPVAENQDQDDEQQQQEQQEQEEEQEEQQAENEEQNQGDQQQQEQQQEQEEQQEEQQEQTNSPQGKKSLIIGNYAPDEKVAGQKYKKDSKGLVQQGPWTQSSLPGFKDSISRYSFDDQAQVSYQATALEGRYCLSIYRVTHPNSSAKALWSVIKNQELVQAIPVAHNIDQTLSGWYYLGEFEFSFNDDISVVLSRAQGFAGALRSDEVRFVRLKEGHDCQGVISKKIKRSGIIDNLSDENAVKKKKDSAGYRQSGNWQQSSLAGFKSISRYSLDPDAHVSYKASLQETQYCISIYRVTHPNSTTHAKWEVLLGQTKLISTLVDHRFNNDQSGWYSLGSIQLLSPGEIQVSLSYPKDLAKDGYLRADAVRFSPAPCR